MDALVKEAQSIYDHLRNIPYPPDVAPSELWLCNIRAQLKEILESEMDTKDVVRWMLSPGSPVACAHPNDSLRFREILDLYDEWMNSIGSPLPSFDPSIQESHLAPAECMALRDGRMVSTTFMWHLNIVHRVLTTVSRPLRRILEIGGGVGGVARLFRSSIPDVTYYIMDLSETLFFSYVYLRANFPEARVKVVLDINGADASEDHDYDFILVPAPHLEYLKAGQYDCVVNTASLGEMTQAAVNRYISFIQDDIDAEYFYSVNRYGQFPREPVSVPTKAQYNANGLTFDMPSADLVAAEAKNEAGHYCYAGGRSFYMWEEDSRTVLFRPYRTGGGNTCDYSTPLDPYWKTRLWRLQDKDSFSTIEYMAPPCLELLVERVPKVNMPRERLEFISKNLFDEATRRKSKDSHWEYLMWESVRLAPSKTNLQVWLKFLESSKYDEYIYFNKLLESLTQSPVLAECQS